MYNLFSQLVTVSRTPKEEKQHIVERSKYLFAFIAYFNCYTSQLKYVLRLEENASRAVG